MKNGFIITLGVIGVLAILLFVFDYGTQVLNMHNANINSDKNMEQSDQKIKSNNLDLDNADPDTLSYCKPDEYPEFALMDRDDYFHYYTGEKNVTGTASFDDGRLIFIPITDSPKACAFIIVHNLDTYNGKSEKELELFGMGERTQAEKPECSYPILDGVFTISVKRIIIPNTYVDNYDPHAYGLKTQFILYPMYFEFGEIVSVNEQVKWHCPPEPV